jgi:tetratricopeptide (TPR) repeat protein
VRIAAIAAPARTRRDLGGRRKIEGRIQQGYATDLLADELAARRAVTPVPDHHEVGLRVDLTDIAWRMSGDGGAAFARHEHDGRLMTPNGRLMTLGILRRSGALLVAAGLLASGCATTVGSIATGKPVPTSGPGGNATGAPSARVSSPAPVSSAIPAQPVNQSPTQARIDALTARTRANPNDSEAELELGVALLQRVRETADASLYPPAEAAFTRAKELAPDDPLPLVGIGTLQLARHEFALALGTGKLALSLVPALSTAQGVVVDALVELGRYDEAVDAVQRMVNLRPDLASYARVSYVRELEGDLPGALDAMRRAVEAGGSASENDAYVTVLYGNLLLLSGRRSDAADEYSAALAAYPDFPAALAGEGRLAVAAGDLPGAIGLFRRASDIVPLPEYVIALGEALEASGDQKAAAGSYGLARVETQLFHANGVVVDLELALFEADHGDAAVSLQLAQEAYAERPTIKAADVLAWALLKNGRIADARNRSNEARRLGTHDPVLLYHAGVIAHAAGDDVAARQDLREALDLDAGFSPIGAAAAHALLASLGG